MSKAHFVNLVAAHEQAESDSPRFKWIFINILKLYFSHHPNIRLEKIAIRQRVVGFLNFGCKRISTA